MGICFSHCDFGTSYGSFRRLKELLAEEAGIQLRKMEGYGGSRPWTQVDDPIAPLFANYDEYGGGRLTPRQSLTVKLRIQELASNWADAYRGKPNHWKRFAFQIAEGMALAAFQGERFEWF